MDRREKSDQPFPVDTGLEREIDAHHDDGEAVDHDVHKGQHSRHHQRGLLRELIVYHGHEPVLARLPHVAHRREASDEVVDSRLPRLDVPGHHDDQRPRLLDDRREQNRKQPKQRGGRPDHGQEKRELGREVSLLDEKISHRTEVERDDDRYEEEKKDVGCRSQHPEEQKRQNYAGENRRNFDAWCRGASQGYLFSSWISSTSTASSSACWPAPSALLLVTAPAGSTPIFCFS